MQGKQPKMPKNLAPKEHEIKFTGKKLGGNTSNEQKPKEQRKEEYRVKCVTESR